MIALEVAMEDVVCWDNGGALALSLALTIVWCRGHAIECNFVLDLCQKSQRR